MENLLEFLQSKTTLTKKDIDLVKKYFIYEEVSGETILLKEGKIENYIYFLSEGIVKGYQNIDGKVVVQHLVSEFDFFTSLDSFITQTPSNDYYETITSCKLVKISKVHYDVLEKEASFWIPLVKDITNEHLKCKLERVKDFQMLTAKERYIKFVKNYPRLALQVSVDNIASFLGVQPQSLSRIRKQITF
ncbi:Crp/Fnr family transcriptional regulator [Tenacibaculum halocynthiae]|uniref:Crp/Fnr family transcriptional regulator n=1 Tax=Tenacibaculum halocynthiae TaxID=1254437 RepID=UPI003D65F0D0